MLVQPYLSFEGCAEEAINFYVKAIGAEVIMLMRMKDSPEPHPPGMMPPGSENKIMHAALKIGDSLVMASDGTCTGHSKFGGITLSLSASGSAQARRLFNALAEGGKAVMPLAKTFFAAQFGVLEDRFGVSWMVISEQE